MFNITNFFKKKKSNIDQEYKVSFATPTKRFLAFIIDTLLIQFLIFACLLCYFSIKKQDLKNINNNREVTLNVDISKNIITKTEDKNKTETEERKIIIQNFVQNNKIFIFIVILLPIAYNFICLILKQQSTIGQKILGLKVIKKDNRKLGITEIINRVFLSSMAQMPILALFVIVFPIIFTKDKFTLYDIITKTYVIEVEK